MTETDPTFRQPTWMCNAEYEARLRLRDDFEHYARICLHIKPKQGNHKRFVFNKAQQHIHKIIEDQKETLGKVRALICKGRQVGCTTYVGGRNLHLVVHRKGCSAYILTHRAEATANIFDMYKRFYDRLTPTMRPRLGVSNAKEMAFDGLDSRIKVGTAGSAQVGRSQTIQYFHGSEVGFWDNAAELASGIFQCVPDMPDTEIILESTANGVGNYFHQLWIAAEAGETDFVPIFIPWFWMDEYRTKVTEPLELDETERTIQSLYKLDADQLLWRRKKIQELSLTGADGEELFKQEYPCCAAEAFIRGDEKTYIKISEVERAFSTSVADGHPFVVGVDPARGGDRTAIMRRRGRHAYGLTTSKTENIMEIVGTITSILKNEKPDKVFIDVCGLGVGVYDRLLELGYADKIMPVNSGEKSMYPDIYKNKRAEMWGEMKKWLLDYPVSLDKSNDLLNDLCSLRYSIDSVNRLQMEKKEDMLKRGLRSPDCADALALTFAYPIKKSVETNNSLYRKMAII